MRRALLVAALLALTGCSSARPSAHPSAGPPVGPACLTGSAAPSADTALGTPLTCFDGGAPAALTALGGPAIVNLWASWCPPCRTELPGIQAYADRAGDKVRVVGVVTQDRREAAQSIIEDKKLTFTMLDDPDRKLLTAVGKGALPVTLFVTGDGRIAYVYNATALDAAKLGELAKQHLGVSV